MLDRAATLILGYAVVGIIVLFVASVIGDIPLTKLNIGRGVLLAAVIGLVGGGVQAILELIGKVPIR